MNLEKLSIGYLAALRDNGTRTLANKVAVRQRRVGALSRQSLPQRPKRPVKEVSRRTKTNGLT